MSAELMSERLSAWEAELDLVRDRLGRLASPGSPREAEQLLENLRSQLGAVVRGLRQESLDAMRRELRTEPAAPARVVRAAVRELAPTTFAAEASSR